MSATNKTRYEVQKIISDVIKSGLTNLVGASHGFAVMEFAQASFQKGDRIVLIKPVRVVRRGWQSDSYPVVSNVLYRREEWIEEQTWQFHFILKKSATPTVGELQADDYAQLMTVWFNGKGAAELRDSRCAPLRIDSASVIVYNDDSELYQKRAVFTVKIQVPKELSITQVDAEQLVPDIKPV